jgi:hypothetical protein
LDAFGQINRLIIHWPIYRNLVREEPGTFQATPTTAATD